ncbi:MAG: hypothetical protein ACI9EK_002607 [Psychroserpens sp.]|jgi:hypothetical protein
MEQPNLNYINQLARGDDSIRKTLLDVIKTEFPQDIKDYYESVEIKDFKKIEENVHRIKHKFGILGLDKSYDKANEFESHLRDKQFNLKEQQNFNKILITISEYLQTI